MKYLITAAIVLAISMPASAQAPGLYAEAHSRVDGADIRRISDPQNHVVCYLATGVGLVDGVTQGPFPAISCVRLP